MNKDCKHYDTCENRNYSDCCGAPILGEDICGDCHEHCEDMCYDCPSYEPEPFDMVQYANDLLKTVTKFNHGNRQA